VAGEDMNRVMIEKMVQLFRKYVYFEEDCFYYLCPIYVLLTHVYDGVFDELPYLQIDGPKATGKSRLGDIFAGLCLNPISSSEISTPFLYRSADRNPIGVGGTFIIDEADDLSNPKQHNALLRILRGGYRRTGNVGRCNPNLEAVQFHTFCPKILINQSGLTDQALESRTIPIPMIKSPVYLEKFRFSKAEKEFKEIKDLMGPFSDEYRDTISDLYDSFQGIDGISDRDEEIWTPVFIIAQILDAVLPEPHIREDMLKLARKTIFQKRIKQLVENRDAQILESTRAYIEQAKPLDSSGLYVGEELWRFVKDRCSLPDLKLENVSRTLNRYALIKDVKRLRLGKEIKHEEIEVQRSCYLIDREKLTSLTEEYHEGGENL
jgi:hypothetical protein